MDTDRANQTLMLRMLRENPGVKFIGLSLDNNDINLYYQRQQNNRRASRRWSRRSASRWNGSRPSAGCACWS